MVHSEVLLTRGTRNCVAVLRMQYAMYYTMLLELEVELNFGLIGYWDCQIFFINFGILSTTGDSRISFLSSH